MGHLRARRSVLAIAGLIALLTACGSPQQETAPPAGPATAGDPTTGAAAPTVGEVVAVETYEDVFAAVEGLTGEERVDALLAMADQEGNELLWYTAMKLELAEEMQQAFTDAYGIDLEIYRAGKDEVLRRVIEESGAGYESTADLVEAPGMQMTQMAREGLFVPYASPVKDDLVDEAVFDDWTAERFNVYALAWNTNLVDEAERPDSWEDLADPRYDGQLALDRADVDWYHALWQHWVEEEGKDPAEADRLFQEMATDSLVMRGHSGRAGLMAAGDFMVTAPLYTHTADAYIDDGAPLSYQPAVGPLFLQPNGTGLMKASRRPATAVLFLDWLLTDGQEFIQDYGLLPARADMHQDTGVESVLMDVEGFVDVEEEWTTRWDDLMRFGETVEQ